VPGTKLTQTITTTTTPRYVNSIRAIEGKVCHVNAPESLILTLPDNKNQLFNVPGHANFNIDGKDKTVFDRRKGMTITATIVTDEEHTVVDSKKVAFGEAPRIITTPPEIGVLLLAAATEVTLASAEKSADRLPVASSSLPLIETLGVLAIATSVSLGVMRRSYAR